MVANPATILLPPTIAAVHYHHHLRVSAATDLDSPPAAAAAKSQVSPRFPPPPSVYTLSPSSDYDEYDGYAAVADSDSSDSLEISRSESAQNCSTSVETRISMFLPSICSGSYTYIGGRQFNEDEHLCVDDLPTHLGSSYKWSLPSSFYGVFDGHGGSEAAIFAKDNVLRYLFQDALLPQRTDVDEVFLEELEKSHRRAFLVADRALADENRVDSYCGTTALTALVLGRHLVIANAGDCRAVLCRRGAAVQISQDHRPSCVVERKRVEDLGGVIECGYLNGELAVTRALGDWHMKNSDGTEAPLTAEPEVHQVLLTEDDEFLIIGCDGLWDIMSNQEAVGVVRRQLREHGDPHESARELVDQAMMRDAWDNLTVVIVCFTGSCKRDLSRPQSRRCSLSEESRKKLLSLLDLC